jgi:hypothetical protein
MKRGTTYPLFSIGCAVLFCLLLARAPAAPAASLLLTGATIHTVSGETLSPGQVLVRDGKIAAVGQTVSADGVPAVDLTGQHLYPGLISLDTVLGLTEIEAVRATEDTTEVGEYTPDVESWIAVNPDWSCSRWPARMASLISSRCPRAASLPANPG